MFAGAHAVAHLLIERHPARAAAPTSASIGVRAASLPRMSPRRTPCRASQLRQRSRGARRERARARDRSRAPGPAIDGGRLRQQHAHARRLGHARVSAALEVRRYRQSPAADQKDGDVRPRRFQLRPPAALLVEETVVGTASGAAVVVASRRGRRGAVAFGAGLPPAWRPGALATGGGVSSGRRQQKRAASAPDGVSMSVPLLFVDAAGPCLSVSDCVLRGRSPQFEAASGPVSRRRLDSGARRGPLTGCRTAAAGRRSRRFVGGGSSVVTSIDSAAASASSSRWHLGATASSAAESSIRFGDERRRLRPRRTSIGLRALGIRRLRTAQAGVASPPRARRPISPTNPSSDSRPAKSLIPSTVRSTPSVSEAQAVTPPAAGR